MKIVVSLDNAPLRIEIEGPDTELDAMVDLATKTLFKMREVWLKALECQMKLKAEKEKEGHG